MHVVMSGTLSNGHTGVQMHGLLGCKSAVTRCTFCSKSE